jgi:hypothetical protein
MDVWNHPDFWISLIVGGGLLALTAIFLVQWVRSQQKRPEAIRLASFRLGMTFLADDEGLVESFAAFPLFQEGRSSKTAQNVLRGSSGDREVVIFDYASDWNARRVICRTVAAFRLSADVPEFSMYPKNMLDRIGERFGWQYIDFETYQEFSRRYRLLGQKEAAIRELFRPQVLNYFTRARGWYLEGGLGWLLIYRASEKDDLRVAPQDLSAFLRKTTRIAHIFREEPAPELPSAPFRYKNRDQVRRPSLFEPRGTHIPDAYDAYLKERRAGFLFIALGVFAFIASMTEVAWTGGYAGWLIPAAFLLSWLGLASVIRGTSLVKIGGGFIVAFFALGISLVFLSAVRSEPSEPTPEESTPQQATPSNSEIAVRVSAWVHPESRELLSSDAEIWLQGHGSLWISRDPVKILGKRPPGQTENLHIYPDGRDGKQMVVPIKMTADMCPQGCDQDTILITITDDSVAVLGKAVKNRSVTFSRR